MTSIRVMTKIITGILGAKLPPPPPIQNSAYARGGRCIMSSGRPPVVRRLIPIWHDTISLLSGGISMKRDINIHYVSKYCSNGFNLRGQGHD